MDRSHVGRYQLLDKLGEGGMGVVYKAFDPLIQRAVAVKLVNADLDDSPDMRQRFFAEARAVGRLSHRNVVTIHDLGEEDGQPFFAMEYLEGLDLGARIRSPETMSLDRKLDIVSQAAEGLAFAHSRGITHRDVKPANIFITNSGQVKILDFGLARLPGSQMTRSRTLLGTINYLAPEQVRGDPADQRTDIFSLGVVFYELLTGRAPFEGGSFATTLHKILTEVPEPVTGLDPCVRPEVSAILDRALAKAPEERYQEVAELLADLAECRRALRGSDCARRTFEEEPASHGAQPGLDVLPPISARAVAPGSGARRQAAAVATPPPASRVSGGHEPASGGSRLLRIAAVAALPLSLAVALLAGWWFLKTSDGTGALRSGDASQQAHSATLGTATPASPTAGSPASRAAPTLGVGPVPGVGTGPLPGQPGARPPVEAGAGATSGAAGAGAAPPGAGSRQPQAGQTDNAAPPASPVPSARPSDSSDRPADDPRVRRSASDAMVEVGKGRAVADAVSAQVLAPDAYRRAEEAESDGRALFGKREFARAAVRLHEAAGLFRLAEIEGRAEQLRHAEADRVRSRALERAAAARDAFGEARAQAGRAGAEKHSAQVFKDALDRANSAQRSFDRGDYDAAAGAFEAAGRRMEEARQQAERESAALAASQPPSPPAPPPAPMPDERTVAEKAVRDVLARYEAAFEARDVAALERIWPGLRENEKRQIRAQFDNASRVEVDLLDPRVTIADGANSATVVARRRYRLETHQGERLQAETTARFTLRRGDSGWVIASFETVG
ncbi:MAG: protein kinase [Vicinamibacterales bacterium]